IPASCSTSHKSAWILGSSPFQNEQYGSSLGSPGSAAPYGDDAAASSVCSHTTSTPQSAQPVNPGRYSALHSGQIMAFRSLHRSTIAAEYHGCYPASFT